MFPVAIAIGIVQSGIMLLKVSLGTSSVVKGPYAGKLKGAMLCNRRSVSILNLDEMRHTLRRHLAVVDVLTCPYPC